MIERASTIHQAGKCAERREIRGDIERSPLLLNVPARREGPSREVAVDLLFEPVTVYDQQSIKLTLSDKSDPDLWVAQTAYFGTSGFIHTKDLFRALRTNQPLTFEQLDWKGSWSKKMTAKLNEATQNYQFKTLGSTNWSFEIPKGRLERAVASALSADR